MTRPADPLEVGGIVDFARRLRRAETSAEATTAAFLARIAALDPKLGAFEHVAADSALAAARAIDALRAAGTDLGPLMGVPVAVKDILAVDGMPAHAGSNLDVAAIIGREGSFVRGLRRAGCVILGKVKTVEFALGATGISQSRGTPWNPWDAAVHRIPGGSSSGPAVAVAAGLCGFAIGSDTGGSVRLPAAFCGIFGHKTSPGLYPLDGVFPLSPDLDTIGPLTRTAADAAVVFAALTGRPVPQPRAPDGVRLGRPNNYFFDNLDAGVATSTEAAVAALEKAGVSIVPVEIPEAAEREAYFPRALPACLLTVLGRERFLAERDKIDPVVAARVNSALDLPVDEFIRLEWRRRALNTVAAERLQGLDGWVTPAAAVLPPPVAEFANPGSGLKLALAITQNSQPGNLFGLCGTASPIQQLGADLPVGLQLLCRGGDDAAALELALMVEAVVGPPPRPDLGGFL